jgi:hypothetical protein
MMIELAAFEQAEFISTSLWETLPAFKSGQHSCVSMDTLERPTDHAADRVFNSIELCNEGLCLLSFGTNVESAPAH